MNNGKFYIAFFIAAVLSGFNSVIIAQNISSSEIPKISGGALYNSVYQLAKYSRTNFKINEVYKKINAPPAVQSTASSFDAINFNGNAANSGFYSIPPDPNGAAGLNYLVNIVNTSIEWYTKSGTRINSVSLQNFFSVLNPLTSCFDPKVIYDQYKNRFVAICLEQTDTSYGSPTNSSRIFVAVSKDDNPSDGWYFAAINSKIIASGKESWADFPGLAVDSNAVYITSNIFSFAATGGVYGGTRLWIISKASLYSGGTASANLYDPQNAAGAIYTTMQPAHTYGSLPGSIGTFLASYSGLTDQTDEYVGIILINNPLSAPTFTNQYIDIGKIDNLNLVDLPGAPQPGSSNTIDVGDRRTLCALWKNNNLWITTTVVPPSGADAGQTTAFWIKINTANTNLLLTADEGYVGGEDISPGTYTYYPSVAVDAQGDMGIGFSASSPTKYAGAYYAGRLASDPAGTIGSSVVYREGLDYYYRTFGGGGNRWGDYSGISIDPSDNTTFWVYNEYAITRGTVISSEDGRWGTAWAKFSLSKQLDSVTVISPNGGENWIIGSIHNITWASVNVSNVGIDYSTNNGVTWNNIVTNVPAAAGTYAWTIPNIQTSSALVRIYDVNNANVGDTSNNVFSINPYPAITITSPNGGEKLFITSVKDITWTYQNINNVKVDYSTDSGVKWINIISSTPAVSQRYTWTIPNTPTSAALVKITDVADTTVGDTSNNVFSISLLPSIVLTSPVGGENWFIDSTYNITWASSSIDSIKIELTTNGGISWNSIINSFPALTNAYLWKINTVPSIQCKIRISDVSNSFNNSISPNNFSINYSRLKGDVDGNGILQAYDAAIILRYYAGLIQLNDAASVWAADVNGDGTVSPYDASEVLNFVVNGTALP